MNWREMIGKVGIQKVADGMGVTYAAVVKYVKGDTFPDPGKKMRDLVRVMFNNLPQDEFIMFLNSLSEDAMGAINISEAMSA